MTKYESPSDLVLSRKVNRERCKRGIENLTKYAVKVMGKLKFNEMDNIKKVKGISSDEDNLRLKYRCTDGSDQVIIISKSAGFRYDITIQLWNDEFKLCSPTRVIESVHIGDLNATVNSIAGGDYNTIKSDEAVGWLRKSPLQKLSKFLTAKNIGVVLQSDKQCVVTLNDTDTGIIRMVVNLTDDDGYNVI
jgi:hypothetical protein